MKDPDAETVGNLEKKFGFSKIKRIPYDGGIVNFLADKDFSQQCFVMSEPITPRRTYLLIFAGLLALTALTVAASSFELGSWHLAVGLTIATAGRRRFQCVPDSRRLTSSTSAGSNPRATRSSGEWPFSSQFSNTAARA